MKTRFGLSLLTALMLLVLSTVSAGASSAYEVTLEPAAPQFGAGAEALINVHVRGESGEGLALDYAAEGGAITGALSLNETGPGVVLGAVYLRRDTPGTATLMAHLNGVEVARTSATFVAGAPVEITVTLEAEDGAAARTWLFDVFDTMGNRRGSVRVSTSGDRTSARGVSEPLPFGDYVAKLAPSRDVAASCDGGAFYSVSSAEGMPVLVTEAGATAAFTIRSCALPAATVEDVAGDRSAGPLPPATGNGQAERPSLSDEQKKELAGMAIVIVAIFMAGAPVAYVLSRIAPVTWDKKSRK